MKKIFSINFAITLIFGAIASGCTIKPIHFDGKSATYTHDVGDFAEAMLQAKDMCGSFRNKGIKHESTSCSPNRTCVSTFACLDP
jgi:hypothetical protein